MTTELLAPAGDLSCLKAAVKGGADAIYFGFEGLNARANTTNFNRENLREAVKTAHLFGVKMYMTLNILFDKSEFERAIDVVRFALECKVDAFIVQDIGLANVLRKKFDGIELHASTQMGVSTLEAARFLKENGFSRVVLARETPLSEIKRIKDNLDVDIEYFVQGALCVGYSGNCYFSSLVENASGNRGKCKQLCRLPYTLQQGKMLKSGYLLSAKDICMVSVLKDLAQAGVNSFKIEGRARREGYVAGATSIYRRIIDNDYQYTDNEIIKLKSLFNRGNFCCGYLDKGKIIYPQINSHIGIEIGKVEKFKRGNRFNEVVISSSHALTKGDLLQLTFEGKSQPISVFDFKKTGEKTYCLTTTNSTCRGAVVNLLVDKALEDEFLQQERKLQVEAKVVANVGEKCRLSLTCQGVSVDVESSEPCQQAKSQALGKDECFLQLAKMGENFALLNLDFESDGVFVRKAELNAIRRDAVKLLEENIVLSNEKRQVKENQIPEPETNKQEKENNKKIVYFEKAEQLAEALDEGDYIVFSPSLYRKDQIRKLCLQTKSIVYLDLPPYASDVDIKLIREILEENENLGVVANNYYALKLTSTDKTIIGSELNVANDYAVEFYKKLGYDKIILNKENIFALETKDLSGVFVHSGVYEKLIYFKHCPIKEHIGGNCGECKFKEGITYSLAGKKYLLKRKKIVKCVFYLQMTEKSDVDNDRYGKVIEI